MDKLDDNRILIISDVGCGPPFKGNRIRVRALLKELKAFGYQVHFAGIKFSEEEKQATLPFIDKWVENFTYPKKTFTQKLLRRFRSVFKQKKSAPHKSSPSNKSVDFYFRNEWAQQGKNLQKREQYKRVWISYVFNSRFLNFFSDAELRIIDTHDVFTDRNQKLLEQGITETWISMPKSEEKKGLMRANRLIAINDAENKFLSELTENKIPVETVRHLMEPKFVTKNNPENKVIGFFGSENPLNVNGIKWFISEVWPEVKQEFPEVTLLIGGTVCSILDEGENFSLFGKTDDPADFYKECTFTINPMKVGTGLKIKTIESLSYGCPVVSTKTGASGLDEFIGNGIMLANSTEEFISGIKQLLSSPGEVIRMVEKCSVLIHEMNKQSRKNLKKILQPESDVTR